MRSRSSKKFTDLNEDLYDQMRTIARAENKSMGVLFNEAMILRINEGEDKVPLEDGPPEMTLRARLVWAYMIRNNLNQTSVAKELGISRETLSRVLRHKQAPSTQLALKLAEVTGFTFNDLFPDFLEEKQGESTTS